MHGAHIHVCKIEEESVHNKRNKCKCSLFIAVALVFCILFACTSCRDSAPEPPRQASVTFKFGSQAFTSGNIANYRIQYRSIPLFGNNDTPGRHTNWTDAPEENPQSGSFIVRDLQCGEWIFYVRVSDASRTFIDVCTGTVKVNENYTIVINEEDSDLTGFGSQDIYIRTDFVYEGQGVRITYENTATGLSFEVAQNDMQVVKTGRSTVDYFVNTGDIPCANYVVTVEVFGEGGTVVMSKEQTAQVRATGTDTLVMRLRAEAGTGSGIVIEGGGQLEGLMTGPEKGVMGEELEYRFIPLTEYTEENAVWYYWYADGVRYSTREPVVHISFETPGKYVVSCTPIGINGEVMKDGVVESRTEVREVW